MSGIPNKSFAGILIDEIPPGSPNAVVTALAILGLTNPNNAALMEEHIAAAVMTRWIAWNALAFARQHPELVPVLLSEWDNEITEVEAEARAVIFDALAEAFAGRKNLEGEP